MSDLGGGANQTLKPKYWVTKLSLHVSLMQFLYHNSPDGLSVNLHELKKNIYSENSL